MKRLLSNVFGALVSAFLVAGVVWAGYNVPNLVPGPISVNDINAQHTPGQAWSNSIDADDDGRVDVPTGIDATGVPSSATALWGDGAWAALSTSKLNGICPGPDQILEFASGGIAGCVPTPTGGGGGGAPTDAQYLVGAADPTLTNEIVAGAAPSGDITGAWNNLLLAADVVGLAELAACPGPGEIVEYGAAGVPSCIPTPTGGGGGAIGDLSDVTITTPLNGESLIYNGTIWVNDAVDLGSAAAIEGNLPVTNLNGGSGAGAGTFWRGDGTWAVPPSGGLGTNLSSGTNDIVSDNGTVRLGGTGAVNNENLDWDFESTFNEVGVSSSTGVTALDFGAIALRVGGLETPDVDGSNSQTYYHNSSVPAAPTTANEVNAHECGNQDGDGLCIRENGDADESRIWSQKNHTVFTENVVIKDATTDNDLVWRAPYAITILRLDCAATGATTPVGHGMEVVECNSGAASCVGTGFLVSMNALGTNFSDLTGTNETIDEGDYWGLHTTTVTTAADHANCTIQYVPTP